MFNYLLSSLHVLLDLPAAVHSLRRNTELKGLSVAFLLSFCGCCGWYVKSCVSRNGFNLLAYNFFPVQLTYTISPATLQTHEYAGKVALPT